MFTGIVETVGKIKSVSRGKSSLSLEVACEFAEPLSIGESVAVNGVCLTVASFSDSAFFADVTPETFSRTSLKELRGGSGVNLERAMKAGGRFGGHIVQGHVDGTGRLLGFQKDENAVNARIFAGSGLAEFMVEKGSVAIDGTSLTIASVEKDGDGCVIEVAVIPHTWRGTILSEKKSGSLVNIECDVIGKYVRHFLEFKSRSAQEKMDVDFADFESYH